MPTNRLPSLPSLPADLDWLIQMKPTLENLNGYLNPPCPLPPSAPHNAHTSRFIVSNIFSTPRAAPSKQARYDLCMRRGLLADMVDTNLLVDDPPGERETQEFYDHVMRQRQLESQQPECNVQSLEDQFRAYVQDDLYHQALAWKEDTDDQAKRYAEHLDKVLDLCHSIAVYWQWAFDAYLKRQGAMPWTPPPILNKLYLRPHVSLPDPDLVERLVRACGTLQLMILTARHELGSLYEAVRAWFAKAYSREGLDPTDTGLTATQLGLLSARARGYRYWTVGPADDSLLRRRNDAPRDDIVPASDLAGLYWQFYHWYHDDIYPCVIGAGRCEREGCTRPLPPRTPDARPHKYCSEICRQLARRESQADSQRRRRARIRDENDKATALRLEEIRQRGSRTPIK